MDVKHLLNYLSENDAVTDEEIIQEIIDTLVDDDHDLDNNSIL